MKRIVLFRFHKNAAICLNRISLIKKYNADVAIYGLYGGPVDDPENIQQTLKNEFISTFSIADKSDHWKWKNSDLAVRLWYENVGKDVAFDMLHLLEWDLILCDSLENIYQHIPANGIGLTGLVPLQDVASKWDWVTEEPQKSEWEYLLSVAKETFHYNQEPFASLGPGACYPKSFLEKYAKTDVPELGHDELRLPLFAQILQTPLFDTGFYRAWFDAHERRYFNCRNENIQLKTVQEELANPHGRRVFHPVRFAVDL